MKSNSAYELARYTMIAEIAAAELTLHEAIMAGETTRADGIEGLIESKRQSASERGIHLHDTSRLDAAEMHADTLERELLELADKYELLTRQYVDLKQELECNHLQAQMESDGYEDCPF